MTGSFGSSRRRVVILAAATLVGPAFMAGPSQAQVQTYPCPGGFGPVFVPPVPAVLMASLKTVPNPIFPPDVNGVPTLRADLAEYIANVPAAQQLGKALFWDMQAGSDNKTSCASCHSQAGADVRFRNQLNPGANASWDTLGANWELLSTDFPFTDLPLSRDTDNIAGSQGVRASTFVAISKTGAESTTTPTGLRQVTGKNTPSAINAVFSHRQFWNGRAQPDFNGVNPFGTRDTTARVWVLDYKGSPVQVVINIQDVSLASQAVGPPLNPVEMSADKRTFPELGKKMLLAKPLGLQGVHPTDSVLGSLADTTKGLKTTYTSLIKQAFQPKWWNSTRSVTVNGKSYTMTQANFSLFWGLSIMLYEATLVSDDTPMDRYLATRVLDATGVLVSHDPALLDPTVSRLAAEGITVTRDGILSGLSLFERPVAPPPSFPVPSGSGVGCIGCHVSAETTSASMRNLAGRGLEIGDIAFKNAGFDLRMERMFTNLSWTPPGPLSPVPQGADEITFDPSIYAVQVSHITPTGAVSIPLPLPASTYDTGWYNLGVRPTADDSGLGGTDPFGKSLSWTRLFQALTNPSFIKVPGNGLGCAGAGNATFPDEILNPSGFPLLSGPLTKTEPTDVAGTFKVPALRNVELNGPYFHNGGQSTLAQVVEFYNRAGDFANPTKAPAIVPLQLSAPQVDDLVAFMLSLTDERVRLQQAPFDHPQLVIPNGENNGSDITITLPAVGAAGSSTPLQRFLNLNPFQP